MLSSNGIFPFYCANGGGKWFACHTGTRFAGCCKRDPCQTGCDPEDRLPAYFEPSLHGMFDDQLCGFEDGLFYTCNQSGFLGCCKTNPCQNMVTLGRCPYQDLGSIILSTKPDQVAFYTPDSWNQSLDLSTFHRELLDGSPGRTFRSRISSPENVYPTSITLALVLIGIVTLASFGMFVLALISHKRQRNLKRTLSSSISESIPLTALSPQLSSVQPRPSIDLINDHLSTSAIPSVQLTPPMGSGRWSTALVSPRMPITRHSRATSILAQALDSTHRRPHKWVHLLVFLTSMSLTLITAFLAVLWFDSTSPLWLYIMSRNYATRFVAISTLIVRTSIDIQACVAATMMAALFLESRSGVTLMDSVAISIMRYDTTPLTLALPVLRGLLHQRKRLAYTILSALLLSLCTTTILLQLTIAGLPSFMSDLPATLSVTPLKTKPATLTDHGVGVQDVPRKHAFVKLEKPLLTLAVSSTVLLMDLSISTLAGRHNTRALHVDFSYKCITDSCNQVYLNQIPRITSWSMGPPFYPAFAELRGDLAQVHAHIADTGVLLRAFTPYTDASARESIKEYDGEAFVIDARVSCQAPRIEGLNFVNASYSNFSGRISSRTAAPLMQDIVATNFSCTYGNINHLSLCQISNNPFEPYTGSLESQFLNNTVQNKSYFYDERPATYGTAFLVVKVLNASEVQISNPTISSDKSTELSYRHEWLDLKNITAEIPAALSLSLCFAPWDAARLPVNLTSNGNRSEPSTTWQPPNIVGSSGSFDMSEVLQQLGVGRFENYTYGERGVLNLSVDSFEVTSSDDRRPRSQRPFTQTDASEIGLSFGGANVPLASNWTVFLTGNILPYILTNFSYDPSNVIAADPAIANLFQAVLDASNVAHALSSVITVLSATSYYNQMPAFDYATNSTTVFYEPVLIPLRTFGFTAFIYVLAIHVVLVSVVTILFRVKTTLSLVGSSWSAVAPLLAATTHGDLDPSGEIDEKSGREIKDMLENASGLHDDDVVKYLKRRGLDKRTIRLEEGEKTEYGQDTLRFRVVG